MPINIKILGATRKHPLFPVVCPTLWVAVNSTAVPLNKCEWAPCLVSWTEAGTGERLCQAKGLL